MFLQTPAKPVKHSTRREIREAEVCIGQLSRSLQVMSWCMCHQTPQWVDTTKDAHHRAAVCTLSSIQFISFKFHSFLFSDSAPRWNFNEKGRGMYLSPVKAVGSEYVCSRLRNRGLIPQLRNLKTTTTLWFSMGTSSKLWINLQTSDHSSSIRSTCFMRL